MNSDESLVDVRGLSMHFGGLKAIDNVDFTLKSGELRCLIGPNGAGKTTFFRLLTGVHHPTHGTIRIDGQQIKGLQTHQIAQLGVGIKTQIPSLFDELSVRENIWLAARQRGKKTNTDEIVEQILNEIALEEEAKTVVSKLSHGQRQWVELGVVLAAKPKLILLDEPAAGMTGHERDRTAELIKRINETCAMIVVEHDMEFIQMIAKTVTVFNRGEVLVEDTINKVLNNQDVKDVYLGKKIVSKAQ